MRPSRLIAGLALCLIAVGARAQAQPAGPRHVRVELVGETRGAAPGAELWVAVVQTIDAGWHTYWRNPGDAGEATQIAWTLPAGWRAGDIVWAAPERLPLGPLMNYGYRGRVLLPVPIEVPPDAKPGEVETLSAKVSMLVCADVCVPQDAAVALDVPVVAGAPTPDPLWGDRVAQTLAAAPKPGGLAATFQSVAGRLRLAVAAPGMAAHANSAAYFYPYQGGVIDQAAPETIDLGRRGLTFALAPAPGGGPTPAEISGVVVAGDGSAVEITARPGPPPPDTSGRGPPRQGAPAGGPGLAAAMGLAFLGGLILNLMPCVLPVLSMKAAALAGHGGEARGARLQGLAFAAGVLATFLALAAVLIALRAGGTAVGWGFELQSPRVVGALALVMLAAALDLSGVYELGTSLQGAGVGLASRGGLVGALATGALAVVVAAPCTAPFMGPALGWALTQPPAAALAVFAALGIGFALPFTALAFTPALIGRLPKPGAWMVALRQLLAFPMYGTAAWLAWVVAQQAGAEGLARVFAAALALALAAWLWGAAQRRQAAGHRAWAIAVPAAVALAAAVTAAAGAQGSAMAAANKGSTGQTAAAVPSEPYSPARLAALRAAGKPVLVNFTAAWCVTCQVNERVALTAAETAAAFRQTGAVYMVGDWTGRDAVIAKALADQGRIGVPLYLVYGADGGAPKVLPQLLTPGLVAQALEDAAKRPAAAGR